MALIMVEQVGGLNKMDDDKMECAMCHNAWTDDKRLGPWLCLVCKAKVIAQHENTPGVDDKHD